MSFLSLPFMSQGGGGGSGPVTIEVAFSRVATLPASTRTVWAFDQGGAVSPQPSGFTLDTKTRTLKLHESARTIKVASEARLIVLGTEIRTILA